MPGRVHKRVHKLTGGCMSSSPPLQGAGAPAAKPEYREAPANWETSRQARPWAQALASRMSGLRLAPPTRQSVNGRDSDACRSAAPTAARDARPTAFQVIEVNVGREEGR